MVDLTTLTLLKLCPPSSHAVLPGSFTREVMTPSYSTPSSTGERIFPLHPQVPFVATHTSFIDILGPSPKLKLIAASADGRSFAHEAGVYIKETEEVFFVSNLYSDPKLRNQISKIRLDALEKGRSVESSWDEIEPTGERGCVTGNGATLYGDKLLWCSQGLGVEVPSALVVVDPTPPYAARPILNNFHGNLSSSHAWSPTDLLLFPQAASSTRSTTWSSFPPRPSTRPTAPTLTTILTPPSGSPTPPTDMHSTTSLRLRCQTRSTASILRLETFESLLVSLPVSSPTRLGLTLISSRRLRYAQRSLLQPRGYEALCYRHRSGAADVGRREYHSQLVSPRNDVSCAGPL